MGAVYRAAAWQALSATLALALAVAALMTSAALADGGWPKLATLRLVALPFAAYGALAWVLTRWRQAGEDVAVANAGVQPWRVAGLTALLCGTCLSFAGEAAPAPAAWRLETSSEHLHADTPRGPVSIRWDAGEARWAGVGVHPDLPRPDPSPAQPPPRTLAALAARWLVLGALLLGLLRAPAPGLVLALGGTVAAFGAAHALAALLT